ncbi:MAG: hypothetical protein ABW189_08260 [Rickettsiales bacterium]
MLHKRGLSCAGLSPFNLAKDFVLLLWKGWKILTRCLVPYVAVRYFPWFVSPECRFAYSAEKFAERYFAFLRLLDLEKKHFSDDYLQKKIALARSLRFQYLDPHYYGHFDADACIDLCGPGKRLHALSLAPSDERKAALRTLALLRHETETRFSSLYGGTLEGNRAYLDEELQILAHQWQMPDILFGSEGLLKKLIDDTHENSANFGLLKQALQYHLNYVA